MRKISEDERTQLKRHKEAVANHPDSSKAHFRLGTALINVGFLSKGQESLERAVELDPTSKRAWVNLGGARLARWDFAGCVEANQKALASDPDLKQAHFNLGLAHMYSGEAEAMVACFKKVLELDPANAAGHYHLAVGYEAIGNREKARFFFERAVGMGYSPDPSFVKVMEQKAKGSQIPLPILEIGPEPGEAVTPTEEDKSKQEIDVKRQEQGKE